jgi:hypothetical protein
MGWLFGLLEAQAPPRQAKKSRKAGQQLRQIPIPVGYDSVAKYGLTLFQQPGSNSRKSGALLRLGANGTVGSYPLAIDDGQRFPAKVK